MGTIDKGGIYEIPDTEYHGDLCTGASLSGSGAEQIISQCPLKFFQDSYLNQARTIEPPTDEMEMGTAVHAAILEPALFAAKCSTVPGFADWRKQEARDMRDAIRAEGRVPLLDKHAARVLAISNAVRSDPVIGKAFSGGRAEATLVYYDDSTGVWCKSRPDYLRLEPRPMLIQLKTCPSAHPDAFERHAYNMGYFQRAAWECEAVMRGLAISELPEYWIVAVERDEPYISNHFPIDPRALEYGFMMNAKAREVFAECVRTKTWPKYRTRMIGLPSYAEFALEARREAGEFVTQETRDAALKFQAPLGAH